MAVTIILHCRKVLSTERGDTERGLSRISYGIDKSHLGFVRMAGNQGLLRTNNFFISLQYE